jgi:hypothetical protein
MELTGDELEKLADWLPGHNIRIACPEMNTALCINMAANPVFHCTLHQVITHLNDFHLWTRESIADWIDSLDLDDQLTIGPSNEHTAVKDDTRQPSIWP